MVRAERVETVGLKEAPGKRVFGQYFRWLMRTPAAIHTQERPVGCRNIGERPRFLSRPGRWYRLFRCLPSPLMVS